MPTDRELASLLWIGLMLAVALSRPGGRDTIGGLIRAFMFRSLVVSILVYVGYVVLIVWVARLLGLWNPSLAKDTAIWLVTVGIPVLWGNTDAAKPGFYRRTARRTVGVSVLVGFYMNLALFPLWAEILLQPLVFLVALASIMGKYDPKLGPAKRLADRLQMLIGLAVLVFVTWSVGTHMSDLNGNDLGLQLLLPIWLTIAVLPFIYPFSLLLSYQSAVTRMTVSNSNVPIGWKAKTALVLGFRLAARDMNALPATTACWQLARTKSVRDGLKIVAEYRQSLRDAEAAKKRAADRLRDNAGLVGTDEEGRQLDQREFAETCDALDGIASCQMGWYQSRSEGYRPEMLATLADYITSHGLPADHGIHLVVSKNRKAWYAWRRTISGWCFAIGSAKAPPDQWRYDGSEPPTGFPSKDPTWGPVSIEHTINWET
jgi:hypothetical protein